MTRKTYLTIALALCAIINAFAQRSEKTINSGWMFKLDADKSFAWVNVPHTYNLDAYTVRNYYRGKAEYRKTLSIPDYDADKCYYLRFDAVSKYAEVEVNGTLVEKHSGGYSSFVADMTKVAREENEIVVRVDNSCQDITPLWADFTFWGGIYRDVWLIATPKQHIALNNHGSKGIFISTPNVSEKDASIEVKVEISNDDDKEARVIVRNDIIAPEGTLLQSNNQKIKVKAGETISSIYKPNKIVNPQLWSPESPSLYKIVTTIIDSKTGNVLDSQTTKTGLRFFAFDAQKGFMLNGKPYKLRGTNRHQDQWPVGVALDDEAHRRDIRLMKDFGCNFIRIAHYPQDDALLEACDELGLLAWEEHHQGGKDKLHTIKVYSNCEEVELIVNGRTCGTKSVDNCFATFSIPLEEGRTILTAKGHGQKGNITDVTTIDNRYIPETYNGDELAINVGSNCYFTSSVSNLTWLPDQQYEHGKWGWIDGKQRSTTTEVLNTVDGPIYQTWLEDLTEYRIDAPAGTYEVELLTADFSGKAQQMANLLGRADGRSQEQGNTFAITICGKTVEPSFSPASEGRNMQANRVRYIVENQGNCIDIKLLPKKGKTFLSGIKVRRL